MQVVKFRLAEMLARSGRTGRDVARAIGVRESNFSQMKRGRVQCISFDRLARLCRELDCTPADLLVLETRYPPSPVPAAQKHRLSAKQRLEAVATLAEVSRRHRKRANG